MSYYWDARFLRHLNQYEIYSVFEVGARFGDESISLSEIFVEADIYSFEANPQIIDTTKNRLKSYERIKFFPFGLGDKEEELPFYPYTQNNIGCSSFLKRIDYNSTQVECDKKVRVRRLDNLMKDEKIETIDLLCMDTQGFELKSKLNDYEYLQLNNKIMEVYKIKAIIINEKGNIKTSLKQQQEIYNDTSEDLAEWEVEDLGIEKDESFL